MGVTTHDAAFATYAPGSERAQRERIASLDITSGIVMVLMAIDHVRVYAGVPAGGPTPGVFFTRWVTHFSAPGFAFLAGTGAFLLGQKLADKRALARYLVERGVILILLELTVLRLAWTFNTDFAHYKWHLEQALKEAEDDPGLHAHVVAFGSSAVIGVERIADVEPGRSDGVRNQHAVDVYGTLFA